MLMCSDKPSSWLLCSALLKLAKLKSTTARSVEHRKAGGPMGAGVPGAAAGRGGARGRAGRSGHLL